MVRRIVVTALVCLLTLAVTTRAQDAAPAAGQTGTITGKVIDKGSGDPIIEAGVEVVGTGKTVRTDLDGVYSVKVPPGTYELRFFAPLFGGQRIKNVTVKAGEVARVDTSMAGTTAGAGVEVVEVVAEADKAAETTQLTKRRQANVVSETVSAEAIKRTPDSHAGEVVQRVPAVTVRDDKFIFVRGLNERYSSALLDGSQLPSTDPERRVVPLDLFPSDFIESLAIVKSFTPDLPGDFAGGLVEIDLREFPEKLEYSIGGSTSGNTQTTFQDFETYPGGTWDQLGLGAGGRALPSDVPGEMLAADDPDRFAIGRSFRDVWSPETKTAPPNTGFNFSVGNTWGSFGASVAGIYTREFKFRTEIDNQFIRGGESSSDVAIRPGDKFKFNNSVFETRVGGLLTGAYKTTNDKVTFRALIDRNSDDQVLDGSGTTNQFTDLIEKQTVLRYTEEQLAFGQLVGEHRWSWLHLDWRTAGSKTSQESPDQRYITYRNLSTEPNRFEFTNDSLGGSRIFTNLDETLWDSNLDLTLPFRTPSIPHMFFWDSLPASFKFGPAYSVRNRDFTQRRFVYDISNRSALDLSLPPDQLLAPENIFPGLVNFVENTQPRDRFTASQDVIGGYGMFELPLWRDRVRIVGGERVEYSNIILNTFDEGGKPARIIKKNLDPLPSANLIVSPIETMNVRFSWSRTVSRPEFRELTPALIEQPRGLRPFAGNPDLVESNIENYDLRWEWFFSPLELVSFSLFKKEIKNPIEAAAIAIGSGRPVDTVANSEMAKLKGFEFEGRKNFGFIWEPLEDLSLTANVAYIGSEVNVGSGFARVETNKTRALQGQAPYIVNAALDYTIPQVSTRLIFNTAGPRIYRVGTFGLPDIFEQPRDELDAVVIVPLEQFGLNGFSMKLFAENLFDDRVLITQGDRTSQRYELGIKAGLGITFAY
jgi:outer membrane receptor protein involved in Fe transport